MPVNVTISLDAIPVPCIPFDVSGGILQPVDLGWCEYRFSDAAAGNIARVLGLCDGTRTVTSIAEALKAPPAKIAVLVTSLYTRGIVQDASQRDAPAAAFQEHMVACGRTKRTQMAHESDLLGSSPHRRQLLGSLVETYHFVSSASYHLGAAVAHAPDADLRDVLSRLFVEEWRHGKDLLKGLVAAGLTEDEVRRSRPLPGTQSVINFLRALAATDLLSYAVCATVNESPKTDKAIKESWDALAASGVLPAEAIFPFRGHELEDEASGHNGLAPDVFRPLTVISPDEQRRIHASLESFIGVQAACYRGMKEFYDAPEGPDAWGL
jgi:hypothetical protein